MATILIIEDEEPIRRLYQRVLGSAGYRVLEAGDGYEGERIYREEEPDLVITDLIMPDREGIELIRSLKKISPEVKIFAISGGGRIGPESYLPIALKLGAVRTFRKPVEIEDLLAAIAEELGDEAASPPPNS